MSATDRVRPSRPRGVDVLLVDAMLDRLSLEHVRDRLERSMQHCLGMKEIEAGEPTSGGITSEHVARDGTRATVRSMSDCTKLIVASPHFHLDLKTPPSAGTPRTRSERPVSEILRGALDCLGSRSAFSTGMLGGQEDGDAVMAGLPDADRERMRVVMDTCCALIAAGNPARLPGSIVRFQLSNPYREGRIVDATSRPLFRRKAEQRIMQSMPTAMGLSAATHGYVDLKHVQAWTTQDKAALDPMSIMRLVSASGMSADEVLLTAAMEP